MSRRGHCKTAGTMMGDTVDIRETGPGPASRERGSRGSRRFISVA